MAALLILFIMAALIVGWLVASALLMAPGWLLYSRLEDHTGRLIPVLRGVGVVWMVVAWLGVQVFVALVLGIDLPSAGPGHQP